MTASRSGADIQCDGAGNPNARLQCVESGRVAEQSPNRGDEGRSPAGGRPEGALLPMPCALLDSGGCIEAVNGPWREGVGRHALLAGIGTDFVAMLGQLSTTGRVGAGVRAVLRGEADDFTFDFATGGVSGSRWFRLIVAARRDEAGGASVVVLDITDHRQVEEALLESEDRYRRIAREMAGSALCTLDASGRILTWSADAERLTGFHARDLLGREAGELFCPEDRQARVVDAALREAAERGRAKVRGQRLRADGTRFEAESTFSDLRGEGGSLRGYSLRTRDLTGCAPAHHVLRNDYERLLSIIDTAMDAIITVDEEQRVVMFNRTAASVFGVPASEAIGSPLGRFIPARFRQAHAEHVRAFGRTGVTNRVMGRLSTLSGLRSDGTEFPIEASISHAVSDGRRYYTVILRDISEKRRLEAQLLHSQKVEGIGRLAGGVAHDFNNLLMGIFNYLTLASRQIEPGHPAHQTLGRVKEAADRAAALTRQLLIFARKQVVKPTVLSPASIINDLAPLLHRLLGEDIALRIVVAPDVGHVLADASQLEQVVMNLVLNARDAMPQGGTLTIEAKNVRLDEAYCRSRVGATPGPHVMIAVTDTGTGMSPEVLSRLFEPFFTTKPPGKGTGLGLATCHGIVQQCGGHIAVYSEPERGTSVKVFLAHVGEHDGSAQAAPARRDAPRGGRETVLLVEDNAMIRDLAVAALREAGYDVLVAEHGVDALRVAQEAARRIHLLITDVVMPEMSGVVLAERLTRSQPGLRVIFMSGYTEETIAHHGVETASSAFLAKPFLTDVLLQKAREVLDAPMT